jgi:hypothetical protein
LDARNITEGDAFIPTLFQAVRRTLPNQAQAIQTQPRFLQNRRQFRVLGLGQADFLRAYVIIHPRERLQTLQLVAE